MSSGWPHVFEELLEGMYSDREPTPNHAQQLSQQAHCSASWNESFNRAHAGLGQIQDGLQGAGG